MRYSRQIHKTKLSGFTRTFEGKTVDVYLAVYGIFDTDKVSWDYYYLSAFDTPTATVKITNDCCKMIYNDLFISVDNIITHGRPCKTPEDGLKWCENFKMKWESGSNDLTSEIRDKKLNEILK